ncbi:MAG: putative metal-binding motif-containing protein [Polyangiales bacterium]
MNHRSHWLALSLVALAWGRNGATQPRPRFNVRRPPITAVTPGALNAPTVTTPGASGVGVIIAPVGMPVVNTSACTDTGTQSCGLGACMVTVPRCQNGRAVVCQANVNQRVPETCDGVDNDCDGVIDNAPGNQSPRSVCPAPVQCEAMRTVALNAGASTLTLAPASGRTCAPPFTVAASPLELQVVTVSTRMAVVLSTTTGGAQLLGANGAALSTSDGLCAAGTSTGAAIVEPGTYVLRATGDGANARSVRVEALPVSARVAAPVVAASGRVTMSTAGAAQGPFNCNADEGVDVRVLVCPRGGSAALSAPRGFLASLEGATGGRTCYPAPQGGSVNAPLPSGSLVIVRAWPQGAERGAAFVDLH